MAKNKIPTKGKKPAKKAKAPRSSVIDVKTRIKVCEGFSKHPCLWDKQCPLFHDKTTRAAAIDEIALECGITDDGKLIRICS